MSLALSTFRGKFAHQIFVGVSDDVITFGLVPGEVQFRALKDGDKVGQLIDHFLTASEFFLIVKMCNINNALQVGVLVSKTGDNFVHALADVLLSLKRDKVIKGAARPLFRIGIFVMCLIEDLDVLVGSLILKFISDILHEQKRQDIVLIFRGIHASAKFVAARPKRCI